MSEKKEFTRYEMTKGSHNKFYEVWLQHQGGDKYDVMFKYGRIGTVGNTSSKAQGVSLYAATKWLENMEVERFSKSYVKVGKDKSSSVKASSPKKIEEPDHGQYQVMQPTAWPEKEVDELLDSPLWGMQAKKNGKFCRFETIASGVFSFNKLGKEVFLHKEIFSQLTMFANGARMSVDGELIGDRYYAFDLFHLKGQSGKNMTFLDRFEKLKEAVTDGMTLAGSDLVRYVPLFVGDQKRTAYEDFKKEKIEGVVFKKLGETYEPGQAAKRYLASSVKVKFWKEASVIVTGWSDKSSVKVALYSKGELAQVGKVTVPEKYKTQLSKKGELIIRVKYLYASEDHQLVQASLDPDDSGSVVRDDQIIEGCIMGQLQYENSGQVDDNYQPRRSIIV